MSRILCSLSGINCPSQLLAAPSDELLYFKLSEVTREQNRSSNGLLLTFWGFFGLDKESTRIQNNREEKERYEHNIYGVEEKEGRGGDGDVK